MMAAAFDDGLYVNGLVIFVHQGQVLYGQIRKLTDTQVTIVAPYTTPPNTNVEALGRGQICVVRRGTAKVKPVSW